MFKVIIICLISTLFISCQFAEIDLKEKHFVALLGGDNNKRVLDEFIFRMERKMAEIYQAKNVHENYNLYLDDVLKNERNRKIQYTELDCQLVHDFDLSSIASRYQFFKYDSVYFDGGIVTIDVNGKKEIEIASNYYSTEVLVELEHLKETGRPELIEEGKLIAALQSHELLNMGIKNYYSTKYLACLPLVGDYVEALRDQKFDYNVYEVKALVFHEIYLGHLISKGRCYY